MTLRQLSDRTKTLPTATSWYLSDLGLALGTQELFTRQAPQKLKALRELRVAGKLKPIKMGRNS